MEGEGTSIYGALVELHVTGRATTGMVLVTYLANLIRFPEFHDLDRFHFLRDLRLRGHDSYWISATVDCSSLSSIAGIRSRDFLIRLAC